MTRHLIMDLLWIPSASPARNPFVTARATPGTDAPCAAGPSGWSGLHTFAIVCSLYRLDLT